MSAEMDKIIDRWGLNANRVKATEADLKKFQSETGFIIPNNLSEYFKKLNGTNNYDSSFFKFNSLSEFIRLDIYFSDWEGSSNYANLSESFSEYKSCFIVADYCFHLFSYAIQLSVDPLDDCSVYILCGDQFKIIASSFEQFLNLYLADSIILYYED